MPDAPVDGGLLLGCDFSSRPSPKKSIVLAYGGTFDGRVLLSKLECFSTLMAWEQALCREAAWLGGFDFPFGLPRELVEALDWPRDWLPCVRHYCGLARDDIRTQFKAFCDARPVGGKFAHRATDVPAGSSPSMKWVNPPVAYMLHAGVPVLLQAGACLPGLHAGTHPHRIALEAYPGLLAREILGRRSYKSDDPSAQTPERFIARKDLLAALEAGQTRLGLRLKLTPAQHDALAADASGDSLDAVLCLMQAAWAQGQARAGHPCFGLPPGFDPLEGWILTA